MALPGTLGFHSLVGYSEFRGWESLRNHQPNCQFTDGETEALREDLPRVT